MSGAPLPRVAVAGRPNVGKSTLVNRLAGRREAIAHETAGVTRDRVEVAVSWGDRAFVLVDTGGFVPRATGLEAAVVEQAARAMRAADLILLVTDVTTGIAPIPPAPGALSSTRFTAPPIRCSTPSWRSSSASCRLAVRRFVILT